MSAPRRSTARAPRGAAATGQAAPAGGHADPRLVIVPPREHAAREWHWLSALNDAPVALLVLSPIADTGGHLLDFRIEYANHEWRRQFAAARAELAGRRLYEALPGAIAQRALHEHVLETGEPATEVVELPGPVFVEYRVARSDGSLVVTARDVTVRALALRALRASEERYRSLVEGLDAIVFVSDLEAGTMWVSDQAERILGYPAARVAERGFWRSLVVPEDRERTAAVWDHDAELDEYSLEYRVRRADGETIWLHERVKCVRGPDGAPVRWYGVTFDVTDLHRLRQRRDRSERLEAVGRFASGVAHDFNEILLAISLFTGLVRDSLEADDPRAADLDQVAATVERGRGLVAQLVDFARGQEGSRTLIDPAAIARDFVPILERLLGRGVEVSVAAETGVGRVLGDRTRFEQILLNLASNARRAMPEGGRFDVEISTVPARRQCCAAGGCVRVVVRDTGVGMSAGTAGRVFEPFFTTRKRGFGAGLGLATVHGIVESFGGTIDVSSTPGDGTSFVILLPRVPDTPNGEPPPPAHAAAEPVADAPGAPRAHASREPGDSTATAPPADDESPVAGVGTSRGQSRLLP